MVHVPPSIFDSYKVEEKFEQNLVDRVSESATY